MNSSGQPKLISIPFATSGIKRTIPNTSQIGTVDGAASYPDGFPPKNFQPLAAGGVPPAGADFNGILYDITSLLQWKSAGGLFKYDSTFANAVGGYPIGARILSANGVDVWVNNKDGNTSNPDSGGSGWGAEATLRTSHYQTFGAALTAAAGKTLIVDTNIAITTNTSTPANVQLQVQRGGFFNISSGVTLTIGADLDAGAFTIFGGAGAVVFATTSRSKDIAAWRGGQQGAVYSQGRTLLQSQTEVGGPVHAFEDNNTLNFTNPKAANYNAYAAFDANTTISGPGSYDHYVGFQCRPTYNGTGEIWSRLDGFNFFVTHSGAGTIALMRGVHIENPQGGGQIGFLAGVYVEELTRGNDNYGFYSATSQNVIRTGAGKKAAWLISGNGQTGGLGLSLQSREDSSAHVLQTANRPLMFGVSNAYTGACTADGRWKFTQALPNITDPTLAISDIISANQRIEVSGLGGITLQATGGAGNGCALHWNTASTGDPLFEGYYTDSSITQRGSVDFSRSAGVVRFNTTSDQNLKQLVGDANPEESISILKNIRLREYYWKEDGSKKSQIGPFAQELYQVFKGAVSPGGDTENGYRPWTVDKTAPIWHLVAGFQAQQKRIDALEAQVAQLLANMKK